MFLIEQQLLMSVGLSLQLASLPSSLCADRQSSYKAGIFFVSELNKNVSLDLQ